MKNIFLKIMSTLNALILVSNVVFADVIVESPIELLAGQIGKPIILVVIGLLVVAGITALIIIGKKNQDNNANSQVNVEPVFGAAPNTEERMESEENEKNNE